MLYCWKLQEFPDRTKENAAYLCAFLCKMLGIGAGGVDSYVLRHYDVTGKNCPAQMVSNPTEWQEFKNKVKGILGGSVSAGGQQHTAQPTTDNVASYKVKITADVLNVRIGPGTDYGVATQVKQGEVYTIVGEVRNGNNHLGQIKERCRLHKPWIYGANSGNDRKYSAGYKLQGKNQYRRSEPSEKVPEQITR